MVGTISKSTISKRRRRTAVAALLAAPLVLSMESPAGAAPPQVVHTRVDVSLPGIDVCGFTVDSVVQGTDTLQIFTDASGNVRLQDESHVVSTLTNEANGKVVYVDNASRDSQPFPVANPDGTTTFTDTLTGVPVRVYTSHSNTLIKDAGYLSIVDTVDADGNLISEEIVAHGPKPFGGDFAVFCDAITAAIG
jgi:hypothetical protein